MVFTTFGPFLQLALLLLLSLEKRKDGQGWWTSTKQCFVSYHSARSETQALKRETSQVQGV